MNLFQGASALVSALNDDSQGQRLLRLDFCRGDGPDSIMLANTLEAEEGLSRDFEYRVEVLSDDARIPLKAVLGRQVTISLVRDDGTLRYFNGYVFAFRFVGTDGGFAVYEMLLKPWLAFLRLRKNSHAFHELLLTEIIEQTFDHYLSRDFQYALVKPAPLLSLAVQHNESDHNHLYRRMEEAGYHTWYEHRADGHTLWIGDDSTLREALDGGGEMAFQSQAGSLEDDGVAQWSANRRARPQKVTVGSYDFKSVRSDRPDRDSMNPQGAVPMLEVYEDLAVYGFKHYNDGEALAQRRMEAIDAQGQDFDGGGNDRRAQSGRAFRLAGHFSGEARRALPGLPLPEDIARRDYLIVSVRHSASNNYQDGKGARSHYRNTFTCVRQSVPWRPPQGYNSSDTRIHGVQTATVVGPEGEEIHTDEYGRVRLQFHWDRVGKFNQASSPWVRVSTPSAGANFGQIALPRVGQEVVVMFIDGHCDRPLVVGSLYNATHMPPWPLPANKTQSGVLSRSTLGGGVANANALRFEDRKGAEEVWLHAEKDQRIEVEHDESHSVGNDRRKTVGHDETVEVKHDRTETVGHDEKITVHNDRTERVDREESIDIGGNRRTGIGSNDVLRVDGGRIETVMMAAVQNVGLGKATNVGGAWMSNVGLAMTTVVGLTKTIKVAADFLVDVGKKLSFIVGDEFRVKVGSASLSMTRDGEIHISGTKVTIDASGPVRINGKDVDVN